MINWLLLQRAENKCNVAFEKFPIILSSNDLTHLKDANFISQKSETIRSETVKFVAIKRRHQLTYLLWWSSAPVAIIHLISIYWVFIFRDFVIEMTQRVQMKVINNLKNRGNKWTQKIWAKGKVCNLPCTHVRQVAGGCWKGTALFNHLAYKLNWTMSKNRTGAHQEKTKERG